jgi:hypothetical protein
VLKDLSDNCLKGSIHMPILGNFSALLCLYDAYIAKLEGFM